MTGKLIVGEPSQKDETVFLNHHKMGKTHNDAMQKSQQSSETTIKGPHGTGLIKSVNAKNHTMVIVHEPISELGWPKMTMAFNVDPSVDLSAAHEGDTINFILKAKGDDDFTIIQIQKN